VGLRQDRAHWLQLRRSCSKCALSWLKANAYNDPFGPRRFRACFVKICTNWDPNNVETCLVCVANKWTSVYHRTEDCSKDSLVDISYNLRRQGAAGGCAAAATQRHPPHATRSRKRARPVPCTPQGQRRCPCSIRNARSGRGRSHCLLQGLNRCPRGGSSTGRAPPRIAAPQRSCAEGCVFETRPSAFKNAERL
jgi:hypothetical protein